MNWNGKTEEEADEIIESSLLGVESMVWAKPSMDNAIEAIENFSKLYLLLPILFIIAALFIFDILNHFKKQFVLTILLCSICFSELTIGIIKCRHINSVYKEYAANREEEKNNLADSRITPYYHLSKEGKNVVVFFMDRAVSSFFARTVEEYPEIASAYTGFVYYPNTVSFGTGTDSGGPGLMGGYEYTPYQMNLRNDIPLVNDHNDATLLMPKLFLDAGYQVTVTNPPWPNYSWKGDLSAFKDYPEIKAAAEKFFNAFFKYGMYGYYDADMNAAACARLCRKDSQAYNYVYSTLNAYHNAPCGSNYFFNSLTEAPMIRWAENAYSLDFVYDAEATYAGREKNYVSGTYRILVMDRGDGFEVCGIVNQ